MRIDRNSETWRAVEKWARDRIASHTTTCTTLGMSAERTEQSRGALVELDLLMDLAKEPGQAKNTPFYSTDFGG